MAEHRSECSEGCMALSDLRGEMNTQFAAINAKLTPLMSDMYNGGHDGVKTQLTVLIASLHAEKENQKKNDDEREKRQEQRDRAQGRRDNRTHIILSVLAVLIAFLGMLFALPPAVHALKAIFNGEIHFPKIVVSTNDGQEYSAHNGQPQHAALPMKLR